MPVGVEDIFAVGSSLATQDCEASRRAAIGRHYYALYHAVSAWHSSLPLQGCAQRADVGVHMRLVERLKNPAAGLDATLAKESRKLSAKLDIARLRRTKADYQLDELVTAELVQTHASSVRRLLDSLPSLAVDPVTVSAPEPTKGESVHPSAGSKGSLVRVK